ncbi:hypothetical protein C8R43DRAFT_955835 [Mycena crocata]|nr:hypothetical protein C8R43DRAFT_955835 [Mycena crocata]
MWVPGLEPGKNCQVCKAIWVLNPTSSKKRAGRLGLSGRRELNPINCLLWEYSATPTLEAAVSHSTPAYIPTQESGQKFPKAYMEARFESLDAREREKMFTEKEEDRSDLSKWSNFAYLQPDLSLGFIPHFKSLTVYMEASPKNVEVRTKNMIHTPKPRGISRTQGKKDDRLHMWVPGIEPGWLLVFESLINTGSSCTPHPHILPLINLKARLSKRGKQFTGPETRERNCLTRPKRLLRFTTLHMNLAPARPEPEAFGPGPSKGPSGLKAGHRFCQSPGIGLKPGLLWIQFWSLEDFFQDAFEPIKSGCNINYSVQGVVDEHHISAVKEIPEASRE